MVYGRSSTFDLAGKLTGDTTTTVRSDATYVTSSTYGHTTGSGEYLLGAVGSMSSSNYRGGAWQNSSTTTNTYQWWSGALQGTIVYSQGSSTFTTELRMVPICETRGPSHTTRPPHVALVLHFTQACHANRARPRPAGAWRGGPSPPSPRAPDR